MSKIPKYNTVQKILNRVFYTSEKSITIFTEDKPSDKILYTILLERLIEEKVKINKIIPLGPKKEVIERSIITSNTKNKSLFIVDADIKIMYNETLETPNLISLKRYCIENYLCCESGITDYLYIKLGLDKNNVRILLDFENYLFSNGKLVLDLYYRLLLSYQLQCNHPFKNASQLFNTGGAPKCICKNAVKTEIDQLEIKIKQKLKQQGIRAYKKEFDNRIEVIKDLNPKRLDIILKVLSGKDQLLPIMRLKINELDNSSKQLSTDQLKRILAEKADIEELAFIKDKILSIVN